MANIKNFEKGEKEKRKRKEREKKEKKRKIKINKNIKKKKRYTEEHGTTSFSPIRSDTPPKCSPTPI